MTDFVLGKNLYLRSISELKPKECVVWDELIKTESSLRRAFLSRFYVEAVDRIKSGLVVIVGYQNESPVFFMPLQRQKGWVGLFGLFEPPGGVMTDYFGIVAVEGTVVDMAVILRQTLGAINGVFFTHLDESQAIYGLKADEFRTGLQTRLQDTSLNYWEKLRIVDKKLVYDTERREKKLVSAIGPLIFEWSVTGVGEEFDWLIKSKRAQYSKTGKIHAPLFDDFNVNLLKEILHEDNPSCKGILSVLKSKDVIVAAHLGLMCGEVMHVWFPVYNPLYSAYSPGRILFKYLFEEGPRHGILCFDRGEGDNQAKRDFSTHEHKFGRGFWAADNFFGKVAYFVQRIAWRFF